MNETVAYVIDEKPKLIDRFLGFFGLTRKRTAADLTEVALETERRSARMHLRSAHEKANSIRLKLLASEVMIDEADAHFQTTPEYFNRKLWGLNSRAEQLLAASSRAMRIVGHATGA